MKSTVMVINMGMKSIRSIIFTENGKKLAFASKPLSTTLDGPYVTQDPVEWWEKAGEVARESMEFVDSKIDFVTITASSSCLVCVDENVNSLMPCIMVSDKRCEDECASIKSMREFSSVYSSTGLEVSTSCMLPKIYWVKQHESNIYSKTYVFLSPNDYLNAKMTGAFATDVFNGMKYHYDVSAEAYPVKLLHELDIAECLLPEVHDVGYSLGLVSAEACKHLGIAEGASAILSTYDAIASFFGSGVQEEGDACDISGTVTTFRALSFKDTLTPSIKVLTMPWLIKGLNIVGGSNNLGGGLIEWARQCFYGNEDNPYEIMEHEASESTVGAQGLVFLPYLLGERAPLWDNMVRGAYFGLDRRHTRNDMVRALFESTGFIDADFVDSIEETGVSINTIRLSGGLARIALVNQIKADATGKEVHLLSEFETTASGAAMLVFEAAGILSHEEAVHRFASVRAIILPNQANYELYSKVRELLRKFYQQTKGLYKERQALLDEQPMYSGRKIENL
jgi:xylulokinase